MYDSLGHDSTTVFEKPLQGGNSNHVDPILARVPSIVNNPNQHAAIFLALTLDMGEDHQRPVTIAVN